MMKGKGKTKSEKVRMSLLFTFSLLLFTSVAWTAELPAGYTAVEYIESTPGGGQYIDTGYIPNIDTYIECVVELPDGQPRSEAAVFGARKGTRSRNAFAFFAKMYDNEDLTCFSLGHTETLGLAFYWGRQVVLRCDKSMAIWTISWDGRCLTPPTSVGTNLCVNTMFVFDVNSAEENAKLAGVCPAVMKLYSFKIKGDRYSPEYVRDFVPCVRDTDLEPGLYDHSSKTFYTNAGSGKFQIPPNALPVVTVGDHPHTTAVWTSGDGSVTNALKGTSFWVVKGTKVTVVFTPDPGYKLESGKFVHELGSVNADVTLTEVPQVALKDIDYLDDQGVARTCGNFEVVTDKTPKLEDGRWYVVDGRVSRSALEVSGSAHLILIDGCELTVNGGLYVPSESAITIYGQRGGTGRLNANGQNGNAGIGGRYVMYDTDTHYCGSVTINGGMVNANGSSVDPDPGRWDYSFDAAGIGGCGIRSGGTVTVNGGRVIADSRSSGAGIGGGSIENGCQLEGGGGGTVTIRGGTVTASSRFASGIGAGAGAVGEPAAVTITGGSIDASIQNNVQKNSTGVPLRKVTLELPSITYEKVSFRGLGKYGLRDVVPVNKRVIFYLPDGQYEVVADFDLSGLDTRSQSYIFIVSGHDVVCRPQEFGLKVNNEDISRGFGKGWVYGGKTLSITGNDQIHQYTLSGVSSTGAVQVVVAASDCKVILSDAIIYTQGHPAFVVDPYLSNVSLQMRGGVSHLATTNATDGTSFPALEVKSALTVDFASDADALRSAVYVFNFGEASAIGGNGSVSVAGGHLCAWSDERAVADTCSFDIAAESSDKVIAQAGESWASMRFVSGQNPDEPILEIAPSRTITIPAEIPHITSVVVSNDFEVITAVRQDDKNVYRVMQEDNVIITYGIEDGCILQSENPQIFRSLREDVVIGSNKYPCPVVREMLTLTLPSSVEGLLFAVYEDGQHVESRLTPDGLVYAVREGCAVQVVCRAADGWRIVGTRSTIDFDPIEQSEVLTAEDFPPVEVDKVSLAINRAFDVATTGTTVKRTQVDGVTGHEVVLGGDIDGGLTLPADLGPIVLDLNGWTIRGTNGVHGTESTSGGDGGPAIRIVGSCGASEGTNTTLSVMNAAQSAVSGSGASAGIVGGNGGDGNPPGTGGLPVVDGTGAAVKVTGDSDLLANGRDGVDLEDDDVDLPAGYSQVDYIESDGSGAYVDTKYVHTPSTRVECVVSVSARQPSSWAAIFGARRDSWRQNAFVFFSKALNDANKSCYNRTGCEQRGGAFPGDLKTKVVCEGNVATWTPEGGASGSINASGGTVDDGVNTMFIFNLNTAGVNGKKPDTSPIAMKLYSFKIYEGETLVRDFVPCVRDVDLAAGLYDRAATDPSKAFYGNAGGGVLDASESVSIRSVAAEKPWYKIAVSYLPRGVEEETTYLLAFEVTANNETRGVTNRVTGLTHRTYAEEIDTSALFGQVRTDPEAKLRILLFASRPQMELLGSTERRFALKPAPSDAFDLVLDANSATNSARYVRSGLSAQYDGIENAGVGVHSDLVTAWVDLSGNGRDAMTGEGLRSVVSNLLNSDSPYTIELFVRPHGGYLREAVGAAVSSDGEKTCAYRNGLLADAFDQPTSDDDILALRVYPRVLTEAEIWHNYRLDAARFAQRLEDGVVYSVTADTTFTGTGSDGVSAGDCAMSVADNAKACLCIDRGHTLTLVGGNGCLSQPGGAGLAVPASATLFIMGDGQLDATGGDGGGGGAGSGGENGTVGETSGVGGAGGDGGAGGAGASAGIGGVGGRGGRGGTGGAKVVDARELGIFNQSGNLGGMGAKAAAGGDMGVVYALGAVTIEANAGSGGSVGLEGTNGLDAVVFSDDSAVSFAAAGGGGGGGGGCGDAPTYGIGGGAGGGGGGGGGGSGGLDSRTAGESPVFLWGATGQCGFLNCGSETAGGRAAVICEGYQGGGAGGGGLAGSQGGDGALYAVETALVTSSGDRAPIATDGRCEELKCMVSFDLAGGTGEQEAFTTYSWMERPAVIPPTHYGHEFLGYYLDGTMYYDADGASAGGYLFRHDAVMVAKWRELETCEIRIPRILGLNQPAVSNLTLGAAVSPSPNGDQWIYRAYRGDSVRISLSACSPFQFAPSGQQTEWEIASLASDITFGMTAGYPLPTVAEFETWSVGSGVVAYTNRAGRLTIVGTGAMDDFANAADVPWDPAAVTEVMIGAGVTKIGKYAFAGLANTVVLNRMTTTAAGSIFAAINGDVSPSGVISPAEFERIDIVDGKAYLGVSVYTSDTITNEVWSVATNGVIEVPAPGKQGFFYLMSKPAVPSNRSGRPDTADVQHD